MSSSFLMNRFVTGEPYLPMKHNAQCSNRRFIGTKELLNRREQGAIKGLVYLDSSIGTVFFVVYVVWSLGGMIFDLKINVVP